LGGWKTRTVAAVRVLLFRHRGPREAAFPGRTGLDAAGLSAADGAMATPTEENFKDYKRAEKKALELLAEMRATTPKAVDIELALLVAIFELHKKSLPAGTIASIIQGHVNQLVPHFSRSVAGEN